MHATYWQDGKIDMEAEHHICDDNDGIAIATSGSAEGKNNNKKKEITCYKCNKTGHYANECDEETTVKTSYVLGKKGSNFLMMKDDMLDSNSDDENVKDYKESDVEYDNLGGVEEAEQEDSDDDTEEESSDDEGTDMDDNKAALPLYKMCYALCRTSRQYQKAGYCSTANPQWSVL